MNPHSPVIRLFCCRDCRISSKNRCVVGSEAGFTDHPEGAGSERDDRVDFDRRVRLEFRGTQLSWDGGLPAMREPDDALGLSDIASGALCDARRGKNTIHRSGSRSMAGCEDVLALVDGLRGPPVEAAST